jgi:hypothetical protein
VLGGFGDPPGQVADAAALAGGAGELGEFPGFLQMPPYGARKNAKSTLSSAVALYCLTCEGEIGPQIKCAATTGSQARIVFDVAKKMAERTPELIQAFRLEALADP